MKYIFHNDPGHGWLAVKRTELIRLGILNQVSAFSYQRGATVYLEEDCDASLFFDAKKALGEPMEFDDRHTNSRSPIRHYQCFQP